MNHNANVNHAATKDGSTALFVASSKSHTDVVTLLLNSNANINQASNDGSTPLTQAAQHGDLDMCKLLLENGANVKQTDNADNTALINSCEFGHIKVANLLLDYDADIDHTNAHGVSAFIAASFSCLADVIERFVDRPRANRQVDLGHRAMHCAIYISENEEKHMFWELHNTLKFKSETMTDKLVKQKLPLERSDLSKIDPAQRIRVIRLLLEYVDDINAKTLQGETAFYIACTQGLIDVAKLIKKRGANITMPNITGITPLAISIIHDQTDMIKWLLTFDHVSINCTDSGNHSPLHRACGLDVDHEEIVRILVENEADLNLCNNDNVSPLSIASLNGNAKALSVLIENDADTTLVGKDGRGPLHAACQGGWPDIVLILLKCGLEPHAKDNNGYSPLHIACQRLHPECVAILAKRDNGTNAQNQIGETPLHVICSIDVKHKGRDVKSKSDDAINTAIILLKHKASVNIFNYAGETALFAAVKHSNIHLANILMASGANVAHGGYIGRTMLQSVVFRDKHTQEALQWTLKQGIDINAQDYNGQTCLHLASIAEENTETGVLLIDNGADLLVKDKFNLTPICYSVQFPDKFEAFLCGYLKKTNKKLPDLVVQQIRTHAVYFNTFDDIMLHLQNHVFDLCRGHVCSTEYLCCHPKDDGKIKQTHITVHWKQKILNNTDIVSFCDCVLNKHGQVCESEHTKQIRDNMGKFMRSLVHSIESELKVDPKLAGSMAEGTRVIAASEFDYVWEWIECPFDMFFPPSNFVYDRCCVQLKFMTPHETLQTSDGYLNRRSVFHKSYRAASPTALVEKLVE